jgi:hypothetical protein
MGINDKAFRLRGLRDRLHLRGKHECTFKQKVEIIIEVLGLVHSPRNLSWCRREAAKLRGATPDRTLEQTCLFGVLDDRLYKKGLLIQARQERKKAVRQGPKKRRTQSPSQPSTPSTFDIWDV